jgi:hypothetical protein
VSKPQSSKLKQEDCKFESSIGYTANLKPAWVIKRKLVSKKDNFSEFFTKRKNERMNI